MMYWSMEIEKCQNYIIILNLLEFSQYEYEKSNSLHPRAPLQNDYFNGKNFSDFCFLI